jgi:hypothetical protein
MPLIIFLAKTILIYLALNFKFILPEFIQIPASSSKFYIQKIDYLFFLFPVFLYSLVNIYLNFTNNRLNKFNLNISSLLIIIFVIFVFFKINTKNGMLYIMIFMMLFLFLSFKNKIKLSYILIIFAITLPMYLNHFSKNPTWLNLIPDINVAINTSKNQEWKDPDLGHGHIINIKKEPVSISTYQRVAWFIEGSKMIPENLLGYGLVEDSFRYLAISKWPDASKNLNHTHSGWLDLALGIGLPGIFFLAGSLVTLVSGSISIIKNNNTSNLVSFCLFNTIGILFIGITTEISTKSVVPFLVFWATFTGALILAIKFQVYRDC